MKSIKNIVALALCVLSLSANAQPIMRIELTEDRQMDILATLVTDISWHLSEAEEIKPSTPDMSPSGTQAVDLGLPSGTLWANMNIGAESPEGYGDYFAWGETMPYYTEGHSQDSPCSDWKADKGAAYNWGSYCYSFGTKYLIKYCTIPDQSDFGFGDYKIVLEESDDAAHVNWGGSWRMPTIEELDELYTECTWESMEQNGVSGYKLTSKSNGNSIFLPAAGVRNRDRIMLSNTIRYWSSSLNTEDSFNACYFYSSSDSLKLSTTGSRYYGQPVRAVKASNTPAQMIMRVELRGGRQMDIPVSSVIRISWYSDESNEPSAPEEVEAVDLGLPSGTLWANMNIGAESPEDFGDYFAWGETKPYYAEGHSQDDPCSNWNEDKSAGYSWNSYQWYNGSNDSMIKYCIDDNKTILDLEDDAANANWGEDWRMPTREELDELNRFCTWTWTITKSGVLGHIVTSKKNGNSIFLPAAGYREDDRLNSAFIGGYYWSSSLSATSYVIANVLQFAPTGGGNNFYDRFAGLPVRAVRSGKQDISPKVPEAVDLGLPSGIKWANMNIGAESPEDYGDYFAWGETEPYYVEGHSQDNPCSNWKPGKSDGYDWGSYKWFNGSDDSMTRYCADDNKTILDLEDDAANANWGGNWRMPTIEEMKELKNYCTWTWTTLNGVEGYIVSSKTNSNSIFLPATGFRYDSGPFAGLNAVGSAGNYWSSSLDADDSRWAYEFSFHSIGVINSHSADRVNGMSVRAVCP